MSNVDEWDGKVPGAFNLRDLGGNPVSGGTIAPGRVFRCDLLHRVDAELGARWLHQNDVRTLIDLRTLGEREGDGFMAASEHLDSLHRGLLDEVWSWEAENAAEDDWFLRDRTLEMYERFPDRIAQVLGDIAAAPANVLFHCTAGKDRTGFAAALILLALGVPRPVVMQDYLLTNELLRMDSAPAYGIAPEVMQVLWRVQTEFLDAALHAVDADHGGLEAYLRRELGLSPVALRELQTLYLQR